VDHLDGASGDQVDEQAAADGGRDTLHLDKQSEVEAYLEVFEKVRLQADPSWKTRAMLGGMELFGR
jgi:hypothetical protein